jgi:alanine dehydrogenase
MKFVSMKIALIAERKKSADNRVALTPVQCVALQQKFPEIKVIVESSEHRCIKDLEYTTVGIPVLKDVSSADVFFGIKEVPSEYLIANKTYFFFSHTIKKQPYSKKFCRR